MTQSINLISLGCSKNLVDSERLLKMLEREGFNAVFEADTPTDIVVINTCGFINDAKEESISEILKWAQAKTLGQIRTLIVMGCLSQRYGAELKTEIPEVDFWAGKLNWPDVVTYLTSRKSPVTSDRTLTTPPHSAYLKIAEGCNRFCAFCAIPLITGRYQSRPIDEILDEIRRLVAQGVTEFNVIAQDLSFYGADLPGARSRLAELIDAMADIDGVHWIRLHYLYPADFPMDILDVMVRRRNVCRYIDIALQHSADPVLNNMRRHITGRQQRELLAEIRRRVPGIHIRTTLMTGFPGESEEEFADLCQFIVEQKFERMGAFAYCQEDDTYAARNLSDSIPQHIKQQRLDKIMDLQQSVSLENNVAKIDSVMEVLVDTVEGDYFICRSEFDSPEVDPVIMIPFTPDIPVGSYRMAHITAAEPYELFGEFI